MNFLAINFFLVSFLSTFRVALASEPGVRVRVTKTGLDYADKIGAILLNSLIEQTQIPDLTVDIQGGPGYGSATAQNIKIIDFRPLTYSYDLHTPNALEWDTTGGSIKIKGDWVAWYKVLFKIWFSGQFTASVNDIRLSATATAFKDVDDKPAVKLLACKAKIGSVNVEISGGFIQEIINLFSSDIAAAVKSAIEGQVCEQAQTVLISTMNQKLKSLPTKVSLGRNFVLDYSLFSDPIVGDSYVQALINGSITWIDGSSAPVEGPPLPPVPPKLERMVYVWGSDYVLNTFFHSAHIHNVSKVNADRHSFPEIEPYLRTTCPGEICVGNISHTVREQYPNKFTEVELQTSSAPTAVVKPNGARFSATVRANLYVEPKSAENLLIVFDIDFAGDLTVNVLSFHNETRLAGDLVIDNLDVVVNKSNVGYISSFEIELAIMLAKPLLQKLANEYLNEGVLVPTIPDAELLNAQVTLMERAVQVDADVKYKNYTSTSFISYDKRTFSFVKPKIV